MRHECLHGFGFGFVVGAVARHAMRLGGLTRTARLFRVCGTTLAPSAARSARCLRARQLRAWRILRIYVPSGAGVEMAVRAQLRARAQEYGPAHADGGPARLIFKVDVGGP